MIENSFPRPMAPIPLVIVQGFFATTASHFGDFAYYLNDDQKPPERQTFFVSVGPVSSLHDRACELYYALVGGTVDYGEEHAVEHGHARFGRYIGKGIYPEWSAQYPLHFLGHSMGGPTIIKLAWLIRNGHFGSEAKPRMILSVNTGEFYLHGSRKESSALFITIAVSAPFRGSPVVYTLGERVDCAPAVRRLSVGAFLGKFVHVVSYFAPILPDSVDMHGDARNLTYHDMSFRAFLRQLRHSDWAESRDATPFDVTLQAAEEREQKQEGRLEPETYYQSFAATMTERKKSISSRHAPAHHLTSSPVMNSSARIVGAFDYTKLQPRPKFLRPDNKLGEEYFANDGVVPLFSQWHPFSCGETNCIHYPEIALQDIKPGVWYVHEETDASHSTIIPKWTGDRRQQEFWAKLGRWLAAVDAKYNHG